MLPVRENEISLHKWSYGAAQLRIFEGALVLNPLAMLFLHLTSKINKENQRNSFGLVDDKLLQTQSNETEAEFMKRIATRMAIRRWRTRELCKIFGTLAKLFL